MRYDSVVSRYKLLDVLRPCQPRCLGRLPSPDESGFMRLLILVKASLRHASGSVFARPGGCASTQFTYGKS